jgi:hypothetical protein
MNGYRYVRPHRKDGPREPPPYNVREELVTSARAKARYHEDGEMGAQQGDWIEVDFGYI